MPRLALVQTGGVSEAENLMPDRIEDIDQMTALNLAAIREIYLQWNITQIRKAAAADAEIVCLGECSTAPFFALSANPVWQYLAESAEDGRTVQAIQELTRELAIVVVVPLYEADPTDSNGRGYNTAVMVDKGEVLGKYRKAHIPQGANEQGSFIEPFYFKPSDDPEMNAGRAQVMGSPWYPVFDTSQGRLGVHICYDRHFGDDIMPDMVEAGAQLVVSPAVTFGRDSRRMWDSETATDAMRNRVFYAVSNRLGSEKPWNQRFFGASRVYDPNGRRVQEATLVIRPRVKLFDLDFSEIDGPSTSGWNLRRDRRNPDGSLKS
jgi:beta-ureidopropionase